MSKNSKWLIAVLLTGILLFYLVPFVVLSLFSSPEAKMGSLLCFLFLLNPLYSIASGLVFSLKCGFRWYLPFASALLFFPSIFLFYNSSAWVYTVGYFALSFAGCGIGILVHRFYSSR